MTMFDQRCKSIWIHYQHEKSMRSLTRYVFIIIHPSDYHLFRLIQLTSTLKHMKKWMNCSKNEHFFYCGTHLLLEKWEKL